MNTLPLQTMQELTVTFTRKKFLKYKPVTVKNLLIKGPVQILSMFIMSQTLAGRECWVPWQSRWGREEKPI